MATKIKIKQSAVVGKVPLPADLVQGELALNTADKLLYSKDSAGAVFSIGGGSSSGLNAAKSEITEFTPTVGQTTFTVPGGYNLPAGHVITVWYNGVRLADADYTATNGTSVVLTTGATYTTDLITVEKQYVESIYGGSEIDLNEYTVTAATQTTFASTYDPTNSFVEVFLNGIKLLEDDYTKTSGTNIVLDVAAVLGDDVVIKVIKILTIATGANADWTQTTTTDPEYIQNKPFNTIGSGLSVTSGVLNASTYSLPTASSTVLGGVKVGANLTITNGVLSSTDTDTQLTDAQIGAMGYIKVDTNTQVTVNNTLTSTSTTEALSAKQGKILNDGKVANSRVLTDVPINAVFTDTTYASSDFNHDQLAGFVANEHIDWTTDQGATNIHAGNYTDTDTTYSAGTGITLTGTVFSTTAETNVQSDWSQATTTADDYIKNKPNVQYTSAIPNATTSASGLMASGDKTKLDGIATSANNYVHPNHSGDVTSTGDGVTVIGTGKVTLPKMADMATNSFIARDSANAGVPEIISASDARTILNVADGANLYVHPTTAGNKHIPAGGSTGEFLKYSASGTAVWSADNDTIYTHPTTAGNKHIPTGGATNQYLKYSSSGTAVWADIAADTNTTYTHKVSTQTDGAGIDLDPSTGSTDTINITGSGSTTVTRVDADTINITSTDDSIAMAIALG